MVLKRFLGVGKYKFNSDHAYRFDTFIWMILIPLFFMVEFFMWKSIFAASGKGVLKGFTFSQMALYFLMSHITMLVTSSRADKKMAYLIKSGKFIRYLVRPIHYIVFSFFKNFWRAIFHFVKFSPLLVFVGYVLLPPIDFSSLQPFFYLVSIGLAHLLKFSYIFSFGLLAFWLKEYDGVRMFRMGLAGFFTGMLIPLNFFPEIIQKVFFYLPFQYMLYVPLQMFLGRYNLSQAMVLLGMQVLWTVIFILISFAIWKRASKKFMGVGV